MSRAQTEPIPLDVLSRLVEQSRPRPPAIIRKPPPPAADDFADEEAPSVVAVTRDGTFQVERLPEPTQRSRLSEILAASTRVMFC